MSSRILQAIQSNAEATEHALAAYLDRDDPLYGEIYRAMRYAALDGGKRIRPFLVSEFCRLYGGKDEAALPLACALEMIHCYSLVHDDLPCMDNDMMRRGKPSCHAAFGEATALLAGDALLTKAFETVAAASSLTPARIADAVRILATAAGADGMIGGQMIDLAGETTPLDYDTVIRMNRLKTGRLLRAACLLGCVAAGHTDTLAAEQYADKIGLTFQLVDDILDAGQEDQKTTFLNFMDIPTAKALAQDWTNQALEALNGIPHAELLCDLARFLSQRQA